MKITNKIIATLIVSSASALLMPHGALAGRGFSYSQIKSAIKTDNADVIIAELERAERFACARCVAPVMELIDHEDYRVREVAAWWFSKRPAQSQELVDLSTARLQGNDATMARNAADILGTFRNPKALPALFQAAERSDLSETARVAVFRAIGTIGHPDGASRVTVAFADPAATVRLAALDAYQSLRGVKAGAELTRLLADDSKLVRRKAVALLGEYSVAGARLQIEAGLQDADFLVRRNAAWALGELGDRASRLALEAAVLDSNSLVSSVAKAALKKLR